MSGSVTASVGATGNSWFMKTMRLPFEARCAPSPSGIPTIWYCFVGFLVSGTRSPTESNAFVS